MVNVFTADLANYEVIEHHSESDSENEGDLTVDKGDRALFVFIWNRVAMWPTPRAARCRGK